MEDSETKTAALEKVAELEDELGHVSIHFTKMGTSVTITNVSRTTGTRQNGRTGERISC